MSQRVTVDEREIGRTTVLLAACLTISWAVIQLQSSLTVVTIAELAGKAVAGIGSSIFLASSAVASVVVGRLMDVRGRRFGLRLGFVIGAAGAAITYAGTRGGSVWLFLLGIATIGVAAGSIGLARVAAADLHPPETRARGISLVLMGSAFGAILGPLVFGPLLTGVHADLGAMATPWLVAIVLLLIGLGLVAAIRIEPSRIRLGGASDAEPTSTSRVEDGGPDGAPARPLREILGTASIRVTVLTVVVAQVVMTTSMGVVSLVMVDHGHDLAAVSISLSVHFLGMYGLVLVVGQVVDRIGHRRSLALGLIVEIVGAGALLLGADMLTILPAMFLVGLGWNVAFVASTTMLADATAPRERARVIGLADALATGAAAVGSLVATEALASIGLTPLVVGAIALALVPLPLVALERRSTLRSVAAAEAAPSASAL